MMWEPRPEARRKEVRQELAKLQKEHKEYKEGIDAKYKEDMEATPIADQEKVKQYEINVQQNRQDLNRREQPWLNIAKYEHYCELVNARCFQHLKVPSDVVRMREIAARWLIEVVSHVASGPGRVTTFDCSHFIDYIDFESREGLGEPSSLVSIVAMDCAQCKGADAAANRGKLWTALLSAGRDVGTWSNISRLYQPQEAEDSEGEEGDDEDEEEEGDDKELKEGLGALLEEDAAEETGKKKKKKGGSGGNQAPLSHASASLNTLRCLGSATRAGVE